MSLKHCLVILVIGIYLVSCNDDEILDFPENEPRLVLHMVGVTTNNQNFHNAFKDGWHISLGSSYGILDYYSDIDCSNWNPLISLQEGSQNISIEYPDCPKIDQLNYYSIDSMKVSNGQEYIITINNSSYPMIESKYTHPDLVPLRIVDFEYIGPGEYNFFDRYQIPGDIYTIELEIQDPGVLNYYELSVDLKFEYDPGDSPNPISWEQQGLIDFEPLNGDFVIEKPGILEPLSLLFTDKLFGASIKVIKIKCFVDERFIVGLNDDYNQFVVASLRNYSPDLYNYYYSSYRQKLSEKDPNSSPMPIPSNIEGGFGVFGGYAENQQFLEINLINP